MITIINKPVITIGKQVTISMSHFDWISYEPKLRPFIVVPNNAYMYKLNMGISVRDEVEEYALGKIEVSRDKVTLTTPRGLWHFISTYFSHLPPSQFITNTSYDSLGNDEDRFFIKFTSKLGWDSKYAYQKRAILSMLEQDYGILKAAPGSGKTIMGLGLGLLKGNSFIWINDRIDLAKQAMNTLIEVYGVDSNDVGLLQGDNEVIKKYTFTTIQKLGKVLNHGFNDSSKSLTSFDSVIIDECHHAVGSYNKYSHYFQTLMELDYKFIYGLTATDKRPDGNESLVYALLGPVKHEVTEGVVTMPAEVVKIKYKVPTSEEMYRSMINQYTGRAMPSKINEHLLFDPGYINTSYEFIANTLPTRNKVLIVSPRVAGAEEVNHYLDSLDIDNFLVHGGIKKREGMYDSKVIVATLDLVKEGFDIPDIDTVIYLGRLPHKLILTQLIGRCERWVAGKLSPKAWLLIPEMYRPDKKKSVVRKLDLSEL